MGDRKKTSNSGEKQITFTFKVKDLALIVAVALAIIFFILWMTATQAEKKDPDEGKGDNGVEELADSEEEDGQTYDFDPEDLSVEGVSIAGKKIIVDAGHGAPDVGSTAGTAGVLEKDVNLAIAKKLQAVLEAEGAEVIMTREGDDALDADKELDFQARENIILSSDPDMFVSIHQNEFVENPDASGPQVFYVAQGSVGKRLAVAIQDKMNEMLDVAEPRIPLDVAYRLLKTGTQPSVIVECGFMSNAEEEAKLIEDGYQQEVAQAITDGIKLYVKRFG